MPLLVLAAAAALSGPLAPAAEGKVECYGADAARKTCRSMGAYAVDPKGRILNEAMVVLADKPNLIVVQTISPVTVKAGKVCGAISPRDIDEARFMVDDQVLSADQAKPLRDQFRAAMASMTGKEVCTAHVRRGAGSVAVAAVNGVIDHKLDQDVRWVSRNDGYRLGF